jgi:hypothetical protein
MQFSNDQRHAETLDFLAEVRDYIARWPAHPVNRDMLAKIDAHLDDPLRRLVKDGAKTRSGANFTPVGREVLRATLQGDRLTITAPAKGKGVSDLLILRRLRAGESLTLKPDADTGPGECLSPSELLMLRKMNQEDQAA